MITKVHIQNFQSHQDSVLEFHPGVNTLVGSSDSGKSAIFRAIGWVVTNRPLGSAFCRWGTKKTQVDLTVDGGIQIGRIKSKSENNYLFQGRELLAGTEVPEDIQRVLKIDPAINIQSQISSPFLLSSSPGEVAAFFNDIAGLSDIDLSIKNLKGWQASHIRMIKRLELDIAKLTEQEAGMRYLDHAEKRIERLEKKQAQLQQTIQDTRVIKDLLHKHSRCSETLGEVQIKANAVNPIKTLLKKAENKALLKERQASLYQTIKKYENASNRLNSLENKAQAISTLSALGNKMDRLVKTKESIKKLKAVCKSWTSTDTAFRTKQMDVQGLRNKIKDLMPEQCPLCGQEVK